MRRSSSIEEALRYLPGDERIVTALEELGVSVEATEGVNPHGDAPADSDQ